MEELRMIPQYPLVPKQAFLVFPEGESVYFQKKGIAKRLVYGNGIYPEYTEVEKNKVREFVEYVRKKEDAKEVLN